MFRKTNVLLDQCSVYESALDEIVVSLIFKCNGFPAATPSLVGTYLVSATQETERYHVIIFKYNGFPTATPSPTTCQPLKRRIATTWSYSNITVFPQLRPVWSAPTSCQPLRRRNAIRCSPSTTSSFKSATSQDPVSKIIMIICFIELFVSMC